MPSTTRCAVILLALMVAASLPYAAPAEVVASSDEGIYDPVMTGSADPSASGGDDIYYMALAEPVDPDKLQQAAAAESAALAPPPPPPATPWDGTFVVHHHWAYDDGAESDGDSSAAPDNSAGADSPAMGYQPGPTARADQQPSAAPSTATAVPVTGGGQGVAGSPVQPSGSANIVTTVTAGTATGDGGGGSFFGGLMGRLPFVGHAAAAHSPSALVPKSARVRAGTTGAATMANGNSSMACGAGAEYSLRARTCRCLAGFVTVKGAAGAASVAPSCRPCAAGTFAPFQGSSRCLPCPWGFGSAAGAASCKWRGARAAAAAGAAVSPSPSPSSAAKALPAPVAKASP